MRFRRRTWFAILVLLAVAAAILAQTGCGEARTPSPEPGPIPVIDAIGSTLAWAGGICAAGGLALSLVSLFYPPLQPFSAVFRIVGASGAAVTGVGVAYLWVAAHSWLVLALGALAGVGALWYFWPRIHRAVDRRLAEDRA